MRDEAPKRQECMEFWRGNQNAWINSEGNLTFQATVFPEKPRHRFRLTRNLIFNIVEREVSSAIQRVPSYEVNPSNLDPENYYASKTSQKIAYYGFDKWRVRGATEKTIRNAVIQDYGFAYPYFDNTKGAVIDPESGLSEGEICINVYGPNEVFWEPGVKYEDSSWIGIQQARSLDEMQKLAPFKLSADASTGSDLTNRQKQSENLTLATEYFERPSQENPKGVRMQICNDKVIASEDYPCTDEKGNVLDEPLLVPLTYAVDQDSDQDMGLVRHLLDPMRTINDVDNKILMWKNMALNPQVIMRNGVWKGPKLNDEPGQVYKVYGNAEPTWRPVPPIPPELFQIKEEARRDMNEIAAQAEPPSGIESGKGLASFYEKNAERRAAFLIKLAEFHSHLMRRCLYLVQKHYTEKRLLSVAGRYGPEILDDFRGVDLKSNVNVVVSPGSLEPRSKESVRQELMNLVQMFPGAFSPEQVMAAIDQGTSEKLIESYELDVARAHEVIQKIKVGPEVLFNEPERPLAPGEGTQIDPITGQETPILVPDPITGRPVPMTTAPGWMPRPFDNLPVQKKVFEDFMKTADFDSLENGMKAACFQYYGALEEGEARKAQQAQMEQMKVAEGIGMSNATRGPGGQGGQTKPLPSMPALNGSQT